MKRIAVGLLLGLALGAGMVRPIPQCQEDEIVTGTGDFQSSGYWDSYVCTNLDDFVDFVNREREGGASSLGATLGAAAAELAGLR